MRALILNSGMGSRMEELTQNNPKCMVQVDGEKTIIERQLDILLKNGIEKFIITTGPFEEKLKSHIMKKIPNADIDFVRNDKFKETNYIYSIYLAANDLEDDIVILHGDLVFDEQAVKRVIEKAESCVAICENQPLPEKDFKAVIDHERVKAVGIEFFEHAMACQPLYKLNKEDWLIWLSAIKEFCRNGQTNCYAEKALNIVTDRLKLYPCYMGELLCSEVDNKSDLMRVKERLGGN